MDYKKIGMNIYTYRKAKRLTQKQLAELIDRAESTIQKYEKGEIEIPNSVLQVIAETLDITYNALVDWDIQKDTNEIIIGISPTLQNLLASLGYRLVWQPDDNGLISLIDSSEKAIYVRIQDLEDLEKSTATFVKFKIHEMFEDFSILE